MVVVDKKERRCKIIDSAVPGDSRIQKRRKIRQKNIKTWEEGYRRYGILK